MGSSSARDASNSYLPMASALLTDCLLSDIYSARLYSREDTCPGELLAPLSYYDFRLLMINAGVITALQYQLSGTA